MQLLKEPLFRAIDQAQAVLAITAHALPGLEFRRRRWSRPWTAWVVRHRSGLPPGAGRRVPFREAYRRVGAADPKP
ncbi:MAG: hypothetical protein R3F17_15805 [Planctomycetota bacterium]